MTAERVTKHRKILRELMAELSADPQVRAVVLFGSVARCEETDRSDIDLWVIKHSEDFVRRLVTRRDVVVELWEGPIEYTEYLLDQEDPPVVRILAEGKTLLDKDGKIQALRASAKRKFTEGPSLRPPDPQTALRDRSMIEGELADAYDAAHDPPVFELVCGSLICLLWRRIFRNHRMWDERSKNVFRQLERRLPDVARRFRNAVPPNPAEVRLQALEWLVDYALQPLGGRIQGSCVLMRREGVRERLRKPDGPGTSPGKGGQPPAPADADGPPR